MNSKIIGINEYWDQWLFERPISWFMLIWPISTFQFLANVFILYAGSRMKRVVWFKHSLISNGWRTFSISQRSYWLMLTALSSEYKPTWSRFHTIAELIASHCSQNYLRRRVSETRKHSGTASHWLKTFWHTKRQTHTSFEQTITGQRPKLFCRHAGCYVSYVITHLRKGDHAQPSRQASSTCTVF